MRPSSVLFGSWENIPNMSAVRLGLGFREDV
jgi:hypothetical protein